MGYKYITLIILSQLFLTGTAFADAGQQFLATSIYELPSTGKYSYSPKNLIDNSLSTAWCAPAMRSNVIMLKSLQASPIRIARIGLINGYAKSSKTYRDNYRIKKISLSVNGKYGGTKNILDSSIIQVVNMGAHLAQEIRIHIKETYPGNKYKDICVSEIITNENILNGVNYIQNLDISTEMALGVSEIKAKYENFYIVNYEKEEFLNIIKLLTSNADEKALRFLLDIGYVSTHMNRTVNSEISETLRDMIVPIIDKNPSIVYRVYSDKRQLMRDNIVSAFVRYIDPYSEKTLARIYEKRPELLHLYKLLKNSNKTK